MVKYGLDTVDSNIEFIKPNNYDNYDPSLDKIKILLIDDDHDEYYFVKKALGQVGYKFEIHHIHNSEDAVEFLDLCPNPDLILLDLKMPRVSGHEILQELRSRPGYDDVFICVLTSSDNKTDIKQSYHIGANAYIVKTHDNVKLAEDLKYVIDNMKYDFFM
jgi:CheY-like chemotaxis protein